jgi:predicted AlkP superfamily pyrophosphatase or phosphodiesterase
MKKEGQWLLRSIFCKLSLVILFIACFQNVMDAKRKVLFVIVDGIPYDYMLRLQPPTLMSIANDGVFCLSYAGGEIGTYSETPTISAIGYTNILTGTWMNKHQVNGNDNLHPNYNYPTIFRIAKDQNREVKTAIYSSWTDNRTVLLGEGKEATRNLKIDYVHDGYDLDTVNYPKQEGDLQIQAIDAQICKDAAQCIKNDAPDLNWLYLWYTDDAFHHNGNGKVSDEAVMTVDKQLADVWESVKYREQKHGEEWLVIITTDHGRDLSGYSHGGQSERERASWIISNLKPSQVNAHFKAGHLSQVDICPTICEFMDFEVPEKIQLEWDGQSFLGPCDIEHLVVIPYDDYADLYWLCDQKNVKAKVLISTSNNFFEGGSDKWMEVGETLSDSCHYRINLQDFPKSKIYKIAVETPNVKLSKWLKK